jgi:hypothetical protein
MQPVECQPPATIFNCSLGSPAGSELTGKLFQDLSQVPAQAIGPKELPLLEHGAVWHMKAVQEICAIKLNRLLQ